MQGGIPYFMEPRLDGFTLAVPAFKCGLPGRSLRDWEWLLGLDGLTWILLSGSISFATISFGSSLSTHNFFAKGLAKQKNY